MLDNTTVNIQLRWFNENETLFCRPLTPTAIGGNSFAPTTTPRTQSSPFTKISPGWGVNSQGISGLSLSYKPEVISSNYVKRCGDPAQWQLGQRVWGRRPGAYTGHMIATVEHSPFNDISRPWKSIFMVGGWIHHYWEQRGIQRIPCINVTWACLALTSRHPFHRSAVRTYIHTHSSWIFAETWLGEYHGR